MSATLGRRERPPEASQGREVIVPKREPPAGFPRRLLRIGDTGKRAKNGRGGSGTRRRGGAGAAAQTATEVRSPDRRLTVLSLKRQGFQGLPRADTACVLGR